MTPTLLGLLPDSTINIVSWSARWLSLLAVIPILYSTVRYPFDHPKRSHPYPGMWGVWFIVGSVTTVGMALGGAPLSSWGLELFLALGPVIVAVVALLWHERLIVTKLDKQSMAICAIGIILYLLVYKGYIGPADVYAAGLITVVMKIVIDIVAAGPTYRNVLQSPEPVTEIITFAMALVSVLVTLAILPIPWTLLSAGVFVFLVVQISSIITVLWIGRRRARQAESRPVEML